jgi:hypothetical protein
MTRECDILVFGAGHGGYVAAFRAGPLSKKFDRVLLPSLTWRWILLLGWRDFLFLLFRLPSLHQGQQQEHDHHRHDDDDEPPVLTQEVWRR